MTSQEDNLINERMEPISPDYVKNILRKLFHDYKYLQRENLTKMKNWVISRLERVNAYKCFLFLGINCEVVMNTFPYGKMIEFMDFIIHLVSQCLSNALIPKHLSRERIVNGSVPIKKNMNRIQEEVIMIFATTRMNC